MHGALKIYANRQRGSKVQLQILQALGPPAGQVEGMHMIRHVYVSSNPHISIIPVTQHLACVGFSYLCIVADFVASTHHNDIAL